MTMIIVLAMTPVEISMVATMTTMVVIAMSMVIVVAV